MDGQARLRFEIVADYVFSEVKKPERVFADETTLPTLAPGSGSTKTAYLWADARDDRTFGRSGPPMVAYRFEDSRSGECAVILQVDGYAAYNKLARSDRGNDRVTLAGCWSHSRRKFYELHVAGSSEVATATVERMARLWQGEKTVRGQSLEARVAARQQASAAIVADLFDFWQQTLRRISDKSKLAEAIRYAVSRLSSNAS